jgi:hypothetical protein
MAFPLHMIGLANIASINTVLAFFPLGLAHMASMNTVLAFYPPC